MVETHCSGKKTCDHDVLLTCLALSSRIMAMKERKKALAGSVVKIAGRDVMLSKKIMISIIFVPLLWLFYAGLLVVFTAWNLSTKVGDDSWVMKFYAGTLSYDMGMAVFYSGCRHLCGQWYFVLKSTYVAVVYSIVS